MGDTNLELIMDSFEKQFGSPFGMLVYMKKLITASDGCCDVLLHVQQHAKRTSELLLKAVHGHLMVGSSFRPSLFA